REAAAGVEARPDASPLMDTGLARLWRNPLGIQIHWSLATFCGLKHPDRVRGAWTGKGGGRGTPDAVAIFGARAHDYVPDVPGREGRQFGFRCWFRGGMIESAAAARRTPGREAAAG